MPSTSHRRPPANRSSRTLLGIVLFALLVAAVVFAPALTRTGSRILGGEQRQPFKWSIATMLNAETADSSNVSPAQPGFYCASCGSEQCRQRCRQSPAVGMHTRFFLCELMPAPGVYDFTLVRQWVEANAAAGLRSIIGFNPKTSRGIDVSSHGSCTVDSAGSPAWMLQPGSIYQPLQNGAGSETSYHLNYRDADVQAAWRGMLRGLRQEFAAMPPALLATVDSIEVDTGHDGEMDPTRNYDAFPAGAPLGWMDLHMYRCVYGGYTWQPARNQQSCVDANGAPVNPSRAWGASEVWRDEVLKPLVDLYGQELSTARQGALGKPLALLITGQILTAEEHSSPCAGCNGNTLSDYAFAAYGMGAKTTSVNPDSGNGNGRDPANGEYRNTPNVFKLNWPTWLSVGEHGVNAIGSGHCCDTPAEFYWAVLNALDKHLTQLHFPATHLSQTGAGADAARSLFAAYAGRLPEDTPAVWIVFRDTAGSYYPDGDNGSADSTPAGRVPCCRSLPNYEWYVYQRNPLLTQVVRTGLPSSYQSLSARSNAQQSLQLDVEDIWPGAAQQPAAAAGCSAYDVTIDFVDNGRDSFGLRYATVDHTPTQVVVNKTDTRGWRSVTLRLVDAYLNDNLPGGADLELVNSGGAGDIFHRLHVVEVDVCAGMTPTPIPPGGSTATPTVTRTPVATPTRTATATLTHTAAATVTPTLTANPSPTNIHTATPTVTAAPTHTASATPTPTATVAPTLTAPATPTLAASATATPAPAACLPALLGALALDDAPKGMASDGNGVYAALYQQPRLALIDAATNALLAAPPLGPGGVNGVAVVGQRVYTANRNAAALSVSQVGNGQLIATIPVGTLPWGVGGLGDRVYVANFADGTVSVINTGTGVVMRTTAVAAQPAFVVALTDRAYVTHINGHLSVLSTNGSLLADLTPGAAQLWGIAASADGQRLYLADRPGQRVLVLATASNQVVSTVALPGPPTALALDPGSGRLFAVDAGANRVYVVDTRANNAYLGSVEVGAQGAIDGGQGIALAQNKVFVANWQARSITILDDAACR